MSSLPAGSRANSKRSPSSLSQHETTQRQAQEGDLQGQEGAQAGHAGSQAAGGHHRPAHAGCGGAAHRRVRLRGHQAR